MLNFNQFLNENNKEEYLYDFFYSGEFGKLLLKIKNPISNELIHYYDNEKVKYTYIDIYNEEYVSYLNYKDALELDELDENVWDNKKRKKMKIGKFINKLLDFKYDPKTVHMFINTYKSILREPKTYFKIYKGDDILKWYDLDNTLNVGMLGSSCMRYKNCQKYLKLYTENPEKISLLVLFENGNEKSIGRSLLWELNDNSILMDRIYFSFESDKEIFIRYAKNNKINLNKFDDKNSINKIYTILNPSYYEKYPFLDTLYIYQPETGLIADTIKHCDLTKDIYILDDIFGSFRLYEN